MSEAHKFPKKIAGRDKELELIRVCLQQRLNCIIAGPPGVGKSTLLRYVAELAPSINPQYRSSYIDCWEFGTETEISSAILDRIQSDYKEDLNIVPPGLLGRRYQSLLSPDSVLPFICIDHIDRITDFSGVSIGNPLISLTESNAVVFLATRNPMHALPNFLANRFQPLYLGPLPFEAVLSAIQSQLRPGGKEIKESIAKRIADISGGHPLVLKAILESISASDSPIEAELNNIEIRLSETLKIPKGIQDLTPGQWVLKSPSFDISTLGNLMGFENWKP